MGGVWLAWCGGGGGGHLEKEDMLMALTAESSGLALRNFTESVQSLFFQLLHVNIVQQPFV